MHSLKPRRFTLTTKITKCLPAHLTAAYFPAFQECHIQLYLHTHYCVRS